MTEIVYNNYNQPFDKDSFSQINKNLQPIKHSTIQQSTGQFENSKFYVETIEKREKIFIENNYKEKKYLKTKYLLNEKYFCLICERLLHKPVQMNCGCRVCEKCFDIYINSDNTKCPSNCFNYEINSDKFRDNAMSKEMNKIPIECMNEECYAKISLDLLYSHLLNCPYSFVNCSYCFVQIHNKDLDNHQEKDCKYKMITCEYCSESLTILEYENIHFNVNAISELCENYPSKCPNKCSDKTFQSIKSHLKVCLTIDDPKIKSLVKINEEIEVLENNKIKTNKTDLQTEFEKLRLEINKMKNNIAHKSENVNGENINSTFIWKINEFNIWMDEAKNTNSKFYMSEYFYTDEIGYKLCIKVYPFGDSVARGSHLSLFIAIGCGKFDTLLQWPFKHKFSLKILNQNGGKHLVEIFKPDLQSSGYQRPEKETNSASGNPTFVSLKTLFENDNYLKNNIMFIKCEVYC